jgi:hypothetical protein
VPQENQPPPCYFLEVSSDLICANQSNQCQLIRKRGSGRMRLLPFEATIHNAKLPIRPLRPLNRIALAVDDGLAVQSKEQRLDPVCVNHLFARGPSEDSKPPILRGYQGESIALVLPKLCRRQMASAT